MASGCEQPRLRGCDEGVDSDSIGEGALGEVFGAAAFAVEFFQDLAEGGADVLG
jgi:hypothetical protein